MQAKWKLAALALCFGLAASITAGAQGIGTGLGKGFKSSDDPINIESDELEINEKSSTATFTGNVIATQSKFRVQSTTLNVFYRDKPGGGGTEVTNMDADGGVIIITDKQKITGAWAKFNVINDTLEVGGGNVVVTQGAHVIRGKRLFVDQKTGKTRFAGKTGGPGGRVRGLFLPPPRKKN